MSPQAALWKLRVCALQVSLPATACIQSQLTLSGTLPEPTLLHETLQAHICSRGCPGNEMKPLAAAYSKALLPSIIDGRGQDCAGLPGVSCSMPSGHPCSSCSLKGWQYRARLPRQASHHDPGLVPQAWLPSKQGAHPSSGCGLEAW